MKVSETLVATIADNADGKIACRLCGERVHVMKTHLRDHHPEVSVEDYTRDHPEAPLLSQTAIDHLDKKRKEGAAMSAAAPAAADFVATDGFFHEVFDLGKVKAAMNAVTGQPLPVKTYTPPKDLAHFVPDVDPNYVFPIDLLKTITMGVDIAENIYLWGMAGTGKSTILEQFCARTHRPWIRVQHTRNTEEAHVIGQYVIRDGATVFELGPLPFAMKYGLAYNADEYDFGMPAVLALYQPVLEGKPLLIKEAPPELRIIRPHPMFRFFATGNTNGTGDETGLYQGTMLQNAANYERFGIVEEVQYMDRKTEIQVVSAQAGIPKEFAEKIVDFAGKAREAYAAQKLGLPPSPRAMIKAARLGAMRGDWKAGLRLSYINRLSRVDQQAANEVLARIFT
jgi:cobaltochelatase CobS